MGSPPVQPRQGPERAEYKGTKSGSSSVCLLLHPTEPEKDGSVCYLTQQARKFSPTCSHRETNSACCKTSYLLLTILTQHLPQRCLEQSRVTDQECSLPSVFTDHRADATAIPGHSRAWIPKQAGSLKALRNRAKEKGDWLLAQNLSPPTHSCSQADRMGTESILSRHKQLDSTLQIPNGPLIYVTL